tara:strand:+ start:2308 stop:2514 length:207 start_codon:yes stop_codon:yes gene_type:complete
MRRRIDAPVLLLAQASTGEHLNVRVSACRTTDEKKVMAGMKLPAALVPVVVIELLPIVGMVVWICRVR